MPGSKQLSDEARRTLGVIDKDIALGAAKNDATYRKSLLTLHEVYNMAKIDPQEFKKIFGFSNFKLLLESKAAKAEFPHLPSYNACLTHLTALDVIPIISDTRFAACFYNYTLGQASIFMNRKTKVKRARQLQMTKWQLRGFL
jgi:hypothetical protein